MKVEASMRIYIVIITKTCFNRITLFSTCYGDIIILLIQIFYLSVYPPVHLSITNNLRALKPLKILHKTWYEYTTLSDIVQKTSTPSAF